MRRLTFGKRMDLAHKLIVGCGTLFVLGFALIGIGTGIIEGVRAATPVLAGLGCMGLALASFIIAMRLEFPKTHGRKR